MCSPESASESIFAQFGLFVALGVELSFSRCTFVSPLVNLVPAAEMAKLTAATFSCRLRVWLRRSGGLARPVTPRWVAVCQRCCGGILAGTCPRDGRRLPPTPWLGRRRSPSCCRRVAAVALKPSLPLAPVTGNLCLLLGWLGLSRYVSTAYVVLFASMAGHRPAPVLRRPARYVATRRGHRALLLAWAWRRHGPTLLPAAVLVPLLADGGHSLLTQRAVDMSAAVSIFALVT